MLKDFLGEIFGLEQAVNCFPAWGVDYRNLQNERKKIEDRAIEKNSFIVGRVYTNDGRIFRNGKSFPLADKIRMYEMAAAQIIKRKPKELLNQLLNPEECKYYIPSIDGNQASANKTNQANDMENR